MPHECWLAPDRDSPTITFDIDIGKQLSALLRMENEDGHSEERVRAVTGVAVGRPRRWHKMFERIGLMYRDGENATHLTDLGRALRHAEETARSELVATRREIAGMAIPVLARYQLRNPADSDQVGYPGDCDLHPYWAVWKAAVSLDNKLHWDEFVRVVMRVLRHEDLDAEISRIRQARTLPGYDPVNNGADGHPLGDRCREPDEGNARDHIATPWLRRAGLGGLLLQEAGIDGNGYWTIPAEVQDLVAAAVVHSPPYREFATRNEWFDYYGRLNAPLTAQTATLEPAVLVARIRQLAPDMELDPKLIARVVTAMTHDLRRHFIIVKGISGTGKTRLVKLLAQAAYNGEVGEPYFLHIAVRPDWTDSTPLLGVFNPIENRYQRPRFLEALRRAVREPERPFFICLDEMNIARVEYYPHPPHRRAADKERDLIVAFLRDHLLPEQAGLLNAIACNSHRSTSTPD